MPLRKTQLGALILSLGVLLAACGGEAGGKADGGEPQAGGSVTCIETSEPASLDPAKAIGSSGIGETVFYALYDALLIIDPVTKEIQPKIATELVPDDTARVWTLRLRDDVVFSDGTPFDAEAVKLGWEHVADPETASPSMGYAAQIKATKVVSPSELQITLVKPNSEFANVVAMRLSFIASPAAMKKAGSDFGNEPVGAGPFTLGKWVRDSAKTLKRNDTYYDAPRPYLDELKIVTVPDQNQGNTMLASGQAGCKVTWSSAALTQLTGQGLDSETVEVSGSPSLTLNNSKPPFDDVRVRLAVAQALDSEQGAKVTGSFVPAQPPLAEFPDLTWPKPDPENAQRLFDEYASENGDIKFTIGAFQDSANQAEAKWIQAALNEYDHVSVEVKVNSAATALGNVYSGSYQAHTWGNQILTPSDYLYYVHTGEQRNVGKYSNLAVDKALDAALASLNPKERLENYRAAIEQLVVDVPYVTYGTRQASTIYADGVHGVKLFNDGLIRYELMWTSN